MKQIIIGLNGPIGIGKTWLTKQCLEYYGKNHCDVIRSTEVVRKHLESQYGVTERTYKEFRDSKHDIKDEYAEPGMTGREIIINFIETQRAEDPHFISKLMCESLRWSTQELVLMDNIGNSIENLYTESWVKTQNMHSKIRRVYLLMNIRTQNYKPHERFVNDSRSYTISKKGGHACLDSNEALRVIKTVMLLHTNLN